MFWYIDGEFVGPEDTLKGDNVIDYGGILQLDFDHFDIWPKYGNMSLEYDHYPRGRVMFDVKIHKFRVVADAKIIDNSNIREQLLEHYGLPNTTIFESDEHYQSEVDV